MPLPPLPAAADQAAVLEQTQQLLTLSPALAFAKAAALHDPLLRERLRRDAFIAMARTQPRDAADNLPAVIDARWLPEVHFAQALDIAWYTVAKQPELSRRLLTATATRFPAVALRDERQYIELPYGKQIRDAARRAAAGEPPEQTLLHLRQNPASAAGLPASEILRLAAQARTEDERETATALLAHVDWSTDAPPETLRGALALLSESGALPRVPVAAINRALTGIADAEDPIAEAVKAASILSALPAPTEIELPDTNIGRLLARLRTEKPAESSLSVKDLFPNNLCLQRYVFHNDDDGVESFESFLRAYAGDRNWTIERTEDWAHLTGRGANGRRIEIYANVPADLQIAPNFPIADAVKARQAAVTRLLAERKLQPIVIVHRGHDHHFTDTRKLLHSGARLVYLGSCRGMENVEDVVTHCRRAQMIATRGVGTTSVNDAFLRALNTKLLEGGDTLNWDAFWASLQPALGSNSHFQDYVAPHHNAAARFLAAWYRDALAAAP